MNIFISLIASGAAFLFAVWYFRSKNQMEIRIKTLTEQQRVMVESDVPFTQRVAFPFVDGLVRFVAAVLPTSMVLRAKKWLVVAGDKTSLSQFLTILLLTSTLIPASYFVLAWIASGGSPSFWGLFPVFVLAVLGAVGPFMILRRQARNRQKVLWRSMPNALDLMTTCVEAGLSLDFALQRVSERYKGPLSEEIQRALREIGLGKTRREALGDMAERIDVPDFTTFVNSIVQAETLGTSVGQVLRAQSQQLRLRRRQRAEQIARQAPIKMVFPTVFLLMPSLFIITIAPMMLSIFDRLD